ncbi:EAL domain-containing protein [Desulfovibrio subterraneus]|uniref:EAL domain-containing protein n=1 Tax=Desulfovibrio subterraneus TaxID=2718620 RepID=UPI0022B8FE1A|nr:EAL domain-containing protein [Desulfovibrio subterraneus]WBF67604.1 EAL domain-containing protein [Desulfovibrio subterraneus]
MSTACRRCEKLPDALCERGILYLVPPMRESEEALVAYLSGAGFSYASPFAGAVSVPVGHGDVARMCSEFFETLGTLEQQDTKTLLMPNGAIPSIPDFMRMQSLSALVARCQGGWLSDIIEKDRIVIHYHPIVSAHDPQQVFAYECLARGLDDNGAIIPPLRMFSIARRADMLFNLDRACRLAAIRDARIYSLDAKMFINFNPTAIYRPEFCLRTTMAAIEETGLKPENIVFEVVESEETHDVGHLLSVLDYYRERGFKVALDDIGAGYSSLNLLAKLKPDYIKLDMELVRNVDTDEYKSGITSALLELSNKLNITSVAEGVETQGEWNWLKEHGADLLQGYYFAKPAPVPPIPIITL